MTLEPQPLDYQEVVIPEYFYRGAMFFSGFPLKACGNDKNLQNSSKEIKFLSF
jgi:hypothetical protein